jgi:beta-lactamase regulating signal transducer with metallopeptidase domain
MNSMLLLKATILLLATLAAARILRRAPAGARHRFWTGVFAGLLALPALVTIVPVLHVRVPNHWMPAPTTRETAVRITDRVIRLEPPSSGTDARQQVPVIERNTSLDASDDAAARLDIRTVLMGGWLIGVLAAAATLTLSLVRVGRLGRSADAMRDPDWQGVAETLAGRLGLARPPRLLSSPAVTTPMAAGILRPTIFLPSSARTWTAEQREIVLAHEIAHLVALDPLRHLITRMAMACYWFHPAAWVAAREAAFAREQACDEAVLSLGTRPSMYARVLLEFADAFPAAPPLETALPIVQPSLLEKRLMAILNGEHRPAPRRMLLVPAAGVVLLTLTVAAAHPVTGAPTPPVSAQTVDDGIASPSVPSVAAVPVVPAVPQVEARDVAVPSLAEAPIAVQDADSVSGCGWVRGRSFNGNTTVDESGGRVVHERVGRSGRDRVIQTTFNDLRVCMVAEDVGDLSVNATERPSQWLDRASRVVMETRRGGTVQQLEIAQAGGRPTTWRIAGAERPVDQATQQWRAQLLAVLDTTWELSMLRGQVSSLRGDISSIEGERSSLRGEISALQGEVSSMRGHASSILGEESSLRGEISAIRGQVSSLRGEISSQRGAISSLNANRYSDREDRQHVDALIAKHEKEIAALEQDIRDYNENARVAAVVKQINELNAAKKVAQIEAEIKAFDLERKIAEIERDIAKLDVEGKSGAIEGKIRGLDADRRGRQLEDRRATELKRLEAAISAIR